MIYGGLNKSQLSYSDHVNANPALVQPVLISVLKLGKGSKASVGTRARLTVNA